MNFNSWLTELQTRTTCNTGAGLPALKRLLARLNNPQQVYPIIHVAGTNGKGTVCTLLAHVLTCAGYRTGLFISPHVQRSTERIQLDGVEITETDFVQAVETVRKEQQEPLNFFELITAAALVYFAQRKAQYVVLETGLGGIKDPTNVCNPVLSIITSIGQDHMPLLGSTLAQIASQKAGIIKPDVPVICGEVSPEAARVVEQAVITQHTRLTWVKEGQPFYEYAYDFVNGFTTLHTADRDEWDLHLLGSKQTSNACMVYQAARQLGIEQAPIQQAFETVYLPARFEMVKTPSTLWVLDGAHNVPAIEELLNFWQKTPYALQPAALVCGFMKDKDFNTMLARLAPHFVRVIVTVPPSPRGAVAADFGELLDKPNIMFEPDYKVALLAVSQSPVALCAGSFYLAGAARSILRHKIS